MTVHVLSTMKEGTYLVNVSRGGVVGLACDYKERVRRLFKENLARYLAGEPLVNVIDRELGY